MKPGTVRIIGGKWRGRKLTVANVAELRPTPDRVRETLFNWLQGVIVGARCLDLFAGTGVLGLEALSRGAKEVLFIDQSRLVTDTLKATINTLATLSAHVIQGVSPQILKDIKGPFEVVFLDPPYSANLLLPCCQALEALQLLSKVAYIYLESKEPVVEAALPAHWKLVKQKKAGHVFYQLAMRTY